MTSRFLTASRRSDDVHVFVAAGVAEVAGKWSVGRGPSTSDGGLISGSGPLTGAVREPAVQQGVVRAHEHHHLPERERRCDLPVLRRRAQVEDRGGEAPTEGFGQRGGPVRHVAGAEVLPHGEHGPLPDREPVGPRFPALSSSSASGREELGVEPSRAQGVEQCHLEVAELVVGVERDLHHLLGGDRSGPGGAPSLTGAASSRWVGPVGPLLMSAPWGCPARPRALVGSRRSTDASAWPSGGTWRSRSRWSRSTSSATSKNTRNGADDPECGVQEAAPSPRAVAGSRSVGGHGRRPGRG